MPEVNHPLVFNINVESFSDYVYVGRRSVGMHFGNPFSHLENSLASVIVGSRDESIVCFNDWLDGKAWPTVEPERRLWILEHLSELKSKHLGCYCDPKSCHASSLAIRSDQL